MPRYYRDKIYTNPHTKALVTQKAMEYSEQNPKTPCPILHERLLNKLKRKHR